ncbi:N-acetylmuramic acid 6-phosphate etherase [Brytella acorum]|uniref:N-acetylmuramic acid 6-phosphate etherase n=1 Tax=Brytella acorum TaxID=2959299 RepID=A0AA35ULU7_9PROT|nr:N-acetylmuramic acid 6-phosphate etherase [Brytella acorum]MDF3623766.1 N-acetylmuramic acid 6-phosphate etherase [Brytella acorum]CAI9119813.1 N-acetylmuramic acid 6-phosphate etherase [Brytella acorum]
MPSVAHYAPSHTSDTERPDPRYADIDLWPTGSVLAALAESQMVAVAVAHAALPDIEAVVEAAIPRLRKGGRMFYVGAGTSGRVGMQDGVELTPTFGMPVERLVLLLAGGLDAVSQAVEGAEDDEEAARAEVLSFVPDENDVVIGVAASGSTPYTCAALATARECGSLTVGVSGNLKGRVLHEAEFGIRLPTGPEVVSGSTRLKAGTAQKVALNMLSTTIMIRLGHVYRGQMVDMKVTNAKLGKRAARMVKMLAGGTDAEIEAALKRAGGNVKRAVLARAGVAAEAIEDLLDRHQGDLRKALAAVGWR